MGCDDDGSWRLEAEEKRQQLAAEGYSEVSVEYVRKFFACHICGGLIYDKTRHRARCHL